MITLIVAWLRAKLAILRWIVVIGGLMTLMWAVHHADNKSCQAEKLESQNAVLSETVKGVGAAHAIETKNRSLSDQRIHDDLMRSWSRD